jgi:hypothetical protein
MVWSSCGFLWQINFSIVAEVTAGVDSLVGFAVVGTLVGVNCIKKMGTEPTRHIQGEFTKIH